MAIAGKMVMRHKFIGNSSPQYRAEVRPKLVHPRPLLKFVNAAHTTMRTLRPSAEKIACVYALPAIPSISADLGDLPGYSHPNAVS